MSDAAGATRRVVAAAAAVALGVGASVGPLDRISETRLFSVHMAQHVVVGDLAPLVLVLGLSAASRTPRLHPLLALGLWTASFYVWHLPVLYDAALGHESVHALQHLSFFAGGVLLWATLVGSSTLSTAWRLGCLLGAGLLSALLGNVFLWSGHPFYAPYAEAPRLWGLSPVEDQQIGGAVLLGEGMAVMLAVFAWLLVRWFAEAERREDLVAR